MEQALELKLSKLACRIRMGVIEGVYHAKSGHPGGSLSIADLIAYLYDQELRVDPKQPKRPDRDRLVLSKGHCAPALYAVLAEKGFFSGEEIKSLRHTGALLQGHPDMKGTPGVDMSTGSLGQGISAACGMALAAKRFQEPYRVYAILGDGESQEGQVWEAAMFAAHYQLDNLTAILDLNGLQIDGPVDEVMSLGAIEEKFAAFGWNVIRMDAHSFSDMERAFAQAKAVTGRPTVIIQKSVKGKGVSFMEHQVGWHGSAPNQEQYEMAMSELKAAYAELEAK